MGLRRLIYICAGLACLTAPGSGRGAPACGAAEEILMEDGSARRARLRGDEFFSWVEDGDGFAMTPGPSGRWQYATRAQGRWVPAGLTPRQRGRDGHALDPAPSSPLAADAAAEVAAAPLSVGGAALLAAPPSSANLAVILVSFANRAIGTTAADWNGVFFGSSNKTINTYYQQASKNRFWFKPAAETQGTANDGVISVTLASNHPNEGPYTGAGTRTAVREALVAADAYINYKAFDTDNNNTLSIPELHLVLIFAGYENAYSSAYTPLLWAHHWSLFSTVPAPLLDGVYVAGLSGGGGYAAVGEYHRSTSSNQHRATIGVICHELGHNLSWPDIYDTDGSSDGVGAHCLMGSGNWGAAPGDLYQGQTPVLPGAYCRQLIGFSEALVLSGEAATPALPQVSDPANLTDMVRLNTPDSQQYFLIENRRLSGFDAGLSVFFGVSSGGGLALWHVDAGTTVNTVDARRLVDLEEAARPVLDVAGAPYGSVSNYYFAGNVTRFDATTSPGSTLNGGGSSRVRVYNVSAAGASMSFTVDFTTLEAALEVSVSQALATGSPAWTWQSAITRDGTDAAQAGAVSLAEPASYMETVVTGPVQVAFWWKHGGEATETLSFLIDGVRQAETGATDWTRQSHSAGAGAHTLRWQWVTLRKSGTAAQAYVDQLALEPLAVSPPANPATLISVR